MVMMMMMMIPIENSAAGRVADIHRLLPKSDLHINFEHFQKVEHKLLIHPETHQGQIKKIISHEQALAQCSEKIQQLDYDILIGADTAGSAKYISEQKITDTDWHGIYDRTDYVAKPLPVKIAKNVWIGERSIILKGTEIGENSIIGAGSVVSGKVPANVVYAGNPAKEIRKLDKEEFKTRESLFTESSTYLLDQRT